MKWGIALALLICAVLIGGIALWSHIRYKRWEALYQTCDEAKTRATNPLLNQVDRNRVKAAAEIYCESVYSLVGRP
jgi:hypothetical protein